MSLYTQKQEKVLMISGVFALCVSGAGQQLGMLLPFFMSTYNLSYDTAGMLISLHSVGNLLAIFLAGFLPTCIGRKKSIFTTAVCMLIGHLIFTSGVSSIILLFLAAILTGIARGGNTNFINTTMSSLPANRATVGFNLSHGGFAIGAFTMPIVLVLFTYNNPNNWRFVTAFICLLVIIQLVVYMRMPIAPIDKSNKKSLDISFIKDKSFWLGAFLLFFYISAEYSILGWLVTYFIDTGLLSDNFSQIMSSLLWFIIFIGRFTGAYISGKVARYKILLVDGIGFFISFIVLLTSTSAIVCIISIVFLGAFMATIYPTSFSFGSQSVKGNDFGCSLLALLGCIGGVLTPALVGFVAESMGIQSGMIVITVMTGMLLFFILISSFYMRSIETSQSK